MKRKTIKRYKPKKRLKITLKYSNDIFSFIPYFVLAFILLFTLKYYSSKINYKSISLTTNTINKISTDTTDIKLKEELEAVLSSLLSKTYSKKTINELENEIIKDHPYLKISHTFNPITGSLSIRISKIPAIAKLKDEEKYLLENMTLSHKNPHPEFENYPLIKISKEINRQNFEVFKKIINSELINLFNLKPVIYIDEKSFLIDYENGIKILLSNDFKLDEKNITKIKSVINDAKSRITSAFVVDARYIDYGKLIIKPL